MFHKGSVASIRLIVALLTVGATCVFAASAMAASVGESVAGTTLSELSLTAGTGALFTTGFAPGNTASSAGALTAVDTNPSWTLTVQDSGTGAGKMVAAAAGCTGSDATLADPLVVSVSSPLGGVTSVGNVSISGAAQTVASATNQLLSANVLTTNYSQTIPGTEKMLTGCVYSLTATYTLQ